MERVRGIKPLLKVVIMEKDKINDTRYIQQHLANERTYLAWIRTGIAIVGLGFVASGIVFHSSTYSFFLKTVSAITGIGAVVLGTVIMILATRDYFRKHKGINEENFSHPNRTVLFTFISLTIIGLLLISIIIILMLSATFSYLS
jgi:putative membrane protein